MSIKLALALFKLISQLIAIFEQQEWFQQGKAAANAEANAEQQKRVAEANAARADADALNAGGGLLHDDGFERPD